MIILYLSVYYPFGIYPFAMPSFIYPSSAFGSGEQSSLANNIPVFKGYLFSPRWKHGAPDRLPCVRGPRQWYSLRNIHVWRVSYKPLELGKISMLRRMWKANKKNLWSSFFSAKRPLQIMSVFKSVCPSLFCNSRLAERRSLLGALH